MPQPSLRFLLACLLSASALPARDVAVAPTGKFAEIDTKPTLAAMRTLLTGQPAEREKLKREVAAHSDRYTPPVLCVLGAVLAADGKMDDAMFWFYAGQLRTRYDINRCADKSVGGAATILVQNYGTTVNTYAFQNPAKLRATIQRVLKWDAETPHNYDHRWINLHGINALAGDTGALSVDEKTWPEIAKSTRETFWSGFRLAIGDNPEDYFTDPDVVALAKAAATGDVAKVDALIQRGVNVNATGKEDATPLWFPYLARNAEGFVRLLDAGANPAIPFKALQSSILDSAVSRTDDEFFVLLLDHKLDPNAKGHAGEPLLVATAGFGAISKMRLLVEHGAEVNAVDSSKTTAINRAATMRQYDKVLYLLDHGADPAIQDNVGRDVASGLFNVPNLTAEADVKRLEVVKKLTERGYTFDEAAIASARQLQNLDQATGKEPPKWLKAVKGINPAWKERHPDAK